MYKLGDEIHIDERDATGARSTGTMRWVMGISILLAVISLSIVWIIPALAG